MEKNPVIRSEQLVADTTYIEYSGNAVDFEAFPGEIISILGPDYCGKSDWLRTFAGLNEPLSGDLYLLGKNIKDMVSDDWVDTRTRLAYVRSDGGLLSAANALQNVMMPASYHRTGTPEQIRKKALSLLESINAGCDYEVLPAYLRRDQQYKVAVARALILEPQALILDNPFTLLDVSGVADFKHFLLNLVKNHDMLLMLVTHDLKFATENSDRILFVSEEHVYTFTSGRDLLESDRPAVTDYLNKSIAS